MRKKNNLFIFLVFFLFSIASVSAQPPFQTSNPQVGLIIDYPKIIHVKENSNFAFHSHVINATSGLLMTNETTECIFQSYYSNGSHSSENLMLYDGFDFYVNIPIELIKRGEVTYFIYCNTTTAGGFVSGFAIINRTGTELTTPEALIYLVLAFGVLLLFSLSFYFLILTPYENEINEKGAVIKITKLKYVKYGLILLTWVLFTWFLNILVGLSDNFVSLIMYYGFFGFMFNIMNRLALPVGIAILIIALWEIVRDVNIYDNIKKFGSSLK